MQEARILNRIIRRTGQGWEIEADQRHMDILAEELGTKGGKAAASNGIKGQRR